MQDARDKLLKRRAELLSDLSGIEEDLDAPVSQDAEDRATERQGDEVLEALGSQDLQELKTIDAALQRVEDGTYGICMTCGDDISRNIACAAAAGSGTA